MKKVCLIILIALAGFLPVFAQNDARSQGDVYQDISGYHGLGTALGADKGEAVRLAKGQALKKIFESLKKDDLFMELYVSMWPNAIELDSVELTQAADGTFSATVWIIADQNAIMLTEEPYRINALTLLNRAEDILHSADVIMKRAQLAEQNLRLSEAFSGYRQVSAKVDEIMGLLRTISDDSVLSDLGTNRKTLIQIAETLLSTTVAGIARLDDIEQKTETFAASEQARNTYDLIDSEVERIRSLVEKFERQSPFYDLPRSQLKIFQTDISAAEDRLAVQLMPKLEALAASLPPEQSFLLEKINLSISDIKLFSVKLERMRKEVDLEIRDPRMARQEREQQMKRTSEAFWGGVAWMFIHRPLDIAGVRIGLPWSVTNEGEMVENGELDISVRLEAALQSGVWVRTRFHRNDTVLGSLVRRDYNQDVSIGFFKDILFGFGFAWNWMGQMLDDADSETGTPVDGRMGILVHLGGVDRPRMKAGWLLTLKYDLPQFMTPLLVPYHLNAEVTLQSRIEDILLVEAGVVSTTVGGTGDVSSDNLSYILGWNVGAALRLPGPFTWGFSFGSKYVAPIVDGAFTLPETQFLWSGYCEYVF